MICSLNILFNHPVSEATPNSKITGAYCIKSKLCKQLGWPLTYQCKELGWSTAKNSSKQLGCIKSKMCKQLGWLLTYQCKQLGWSTAKNSSKQLGCKRAKCANS
jgi:hypothetical protein